MENEITVQSIYNDIHRCATNYFIGQKMGMFGINVYDELDSVCHEMESEVLPSMANLSEEEQMELLNMLKELNKKDKLELSKDFIITSINTLQSLIINGKGKQR